MTDIVTVPCKYLVVSTGFTRRLLTPELGKLLVQFSRNRGVIPIMIYDSEYASNFVSLCIENDTIDLSTDSTQNGICYLIVDKLGRNELNYDGIIVFKLDNFDQATRVFLELGQLQYCHVDCITGITFLKNYAGSIDFCYISIDATS